MSANFFFKKPVMVITIVTATIVACNSTDNSSATSDTSAATTATTTQDPISRGKYLVTIGQCNDCHSPKFITEKGLVDDSTRRLSGHPANDKLPPIVKSDWIQMTPDATAFAGPWGISYAANLTPDSATGIGAWSEQTFMQTLRTGKHLGNANGRDILPPMPWYNVAPMTDEDLKAVYAYLQSLPAIDNKVPQPVAPPDMAKMIAK